MRKLVKLLAAALAVFMTISSMQLMVWGDESAKVLASWKGIEAKNTDEGFVKDEATGVLKVPVDFNGHVWGLYMNPEEVGLSGGDIYKLGVIIKINGVEEDADRIRVNPGFAAPAGNSELGADFEVSEIEEHIGETVILVGAFTLPEGCTSVENRIWHSKGTDIEVLEFIVAENGYNFEGYQGYSVMAEKCDINDQNAVENIETEQKEQESEEGNDGPKDTEEQPGGNENDEPQDTDGDKTETPQTGDFSIALTFCCITLSAVGIMLFNKDRRKA